MRIHLLASVAVLATVITSAGATYLVSSSSYADTARWTIMVYMANDYPVPLDWQDDINEMEAAVQAPGTTILALVDDYGPANSQLLKVEHDPNFLDTTMVSTPIDQGGAIFPGQEADMASSETLAAFVNFSAAAYAADRYVLILWGHGAGWRGLCPDGTDLINLSELDEALTAVVPSLGHAIDMLVIDSCAEATAEMLLEGIPMGVLVASEKDVPYAGLPYTLILNRLASNTLQTTEEFGREIADTYVMWSRTNSEYSTTMAVFTDTGYLYHQLRNLSELGRALDQAFHSELVRALQAAEAYETPYSVDLGDFLGKLMAASLPTELRYEAYRTLVALDRATICFAKFDNVFASDGIRVRNATGLSIYVPEEAPPDAAYSGLGIAATGWDLFGFELRNDTLQIPLGPAPDVQILEGPSGDQSAEISWDVGYELIRVWVFQSTPEGVVLMDVVESENGTVVIDGLIGTLAVSACGYLSGAVVGHSSMTLALEGRTAIDVSVMRDGSRVTDGVKVTLSSSNATIEGRLTSDGRFSLDLAVPSDADAGELVRIDVLDSATGDLLGRTWARVGWYDEPVAVEIVSGRGQRTPTAVALAFALLPGLLILVYAALLYREQKTP